MIGNQEMVRSRFAEGCNEDSRDCIVLRRIVISEYFGCCGKTGMYACLVAIASELSPELGRYSDRALSKARSL